MITITPFEGEFCGDIRTMFSINSRKPLQEHSSVTTSEECPHCKKRNIFRLYNVKKTIEKGNIYKDIYDCKCPNCNKEFDLIIEDTID